MIIAPTRGWDPAEKSVVGGGIEDVGFESHWKVF